MRNSPGTQLDARMLVSDQDVTMDLLLHLGPIYGQDTVRNTRLEY